MSLKEHIEELIGSGADDFAISQAFKAAIKGYLGSLSELFAQDAGKEFLVRHTRQLDSFLIEIYKYIVRDSFGNYSPMSNAIPITLVALGSFGREQLSVYSDIDIMLLYKDIKGYNIKPILERFLYLAWDAGLKIGHRVHEIGEILDVSRSDITIKTAIIESRFLYGSKFLWTEYQNTLSKVRKDDPKEFVSAKLAEFAARRVKYPISMEPNIKEGTGSLRDSNTLFWIANILYAVDSNKQLSGRLFSESDYKEYRQAIEFLFKLRIALHLAAGKKQDALIMQYQPDIAKLLGFKDTSTQKAERALVAKTLRSMAAIEQFCTVNIEKLRRKIFCDVSANFATLRQTGLKHGFYLCDGTVRVSFHKKAKSLMGCITELLELPDIELLFDTSVVDYLARCGHSKRQPKLSRIVLSRLFSRRHTYPILTLLYRAGVLSKLLAPFEPILHLAQFDGYHLYPVDIHTLECIKALENIGDEFVKTVYDEMDDHLKTLLKLALFFHDIGKGRVQNHSVLGAKIFVGMMRRLGSDEQLTELGRIVILHHTLMSNTAQREDLDNERTILSFVAPLRTKNAVDLLYVLTYADMNGVGSEVYNYLTAKLLRELYKKAILKLQNEELVTETAARLAKTQQLGKNSEFALLAPKLKKEILSIPSNLFFIKHAVPDILDISRWCEQTEKLGYRMQNEGIFSFEIIAKAPINLGWLLGKLSYMGVAGMEIFKLFGGAKYFKVVFSSAVEPHEAQLAQELIELSLDMNRKVEYKRPLIAKNELSLDCDHSQTYAKMQLVTKDQNGLLAFVIEVFDELGIDVASTKINTVKSVARDMFLIEKSSGICLKWAEVVKKLTK